MLRTIKLPKHLQIFGAIIDAFGGVVLFMKEVLDTARHRPCTRQAVYEQIVKVSMQSLSTVAMSGFFVGAILAVQFAIQLEEFGALGYLGGLTMSVTIREVGPLLIAFMLAGKVGAFTAAELGTMKVTEQIDAIRCLGADPIQEIILPRFIGIVVSSFVLLTIGVMMSLGGGVLLAFLFSSISPEEYVRHIMTILQTASLLGGAFKSGVFAFTLAAICTYRGYITTGGARGVGLAVVQTSVASMMSICLTDWLTSLISETTAKVLEGLWL